MKQVLKFSIVMALTLLILCACPMDIRYPLIVENKSGHSITCYFHMKYDIGTYYPDTLLPSVAPVNIYKIEPDRDYHEDSPKKWKHIFADSLTDTLSIFIFHTDTLNEYSWKKIRDDYMILKRYDLSMGDLKKLDYFVLYPPSSEMSNMKMYPPYEE